MNLFGPWHILVVLVVALLVFGPDKLPQMARQLGKGMRELRDIQATLRGEIHGLLDDHDDEPQAPPAYSGRPVPAVRRLPGVPMPSRYRTPNGGRVSSPPTTRVVVQVEIPSAPPAPPVAKRRPPSRFRPPPPAAPSGNGAS